MNNMEVFGREQLVKNLSRFKEDTVQKVVRACEITQARVANFAKLNHPYVDRTGALTNSIIPGRIIVDDSSVAAEIRAGDFKAPYASYVEFGTSRAKPYPYLLPALAAHQKDFQETVRAAIE